MHVSSAAELGRTRKVRLAALAAASFLAVILPILGGGSPASAAAPYPLGNGYWLSAADGGIFNYGDAQFKGSEGAKNLTAPIVDIEATPFYEGYWTVGSDGGVFAHGSAAFYGSEGATKLNMPVIGVAAHASGRGYWLAATDGGVFSHGAAKFFGSMGGNRLNSPVVGIVGTPTGFGYWLVAADGGVFAFGDAKFLGSMGGKPLNQEIVGIEATKTGMGYWLVAADGGIFAFGDAGFYGSTGGTHLNAPVLSMARDPKSDGYWLSASDGGVFSFGGAKFLGSAGNVDLAAPIFGIASRPDFSVVVDPFRDDTGRSSNWSDGPDEQLVLTHSSGVAAGARVIGVEGLTVKQLGTVGFTKKSGTCAGNTPQLAIYVDTDGDGSFDQTNTINCNEAGAAAADPTTQGSNPLGPDNTVTAIDVLYAGTGTVNIDDITVAGVTVGSHRIHTNSGPGPV